MFGPLVPKAFAFKALNLLVFVSLAARDPG